ncbi:MAG: glycerol-3-phosphate 1-O-acyltransferase PlsY [Firmicutes bacterium]|nr:glycerol-3-phosphate 1-O-acyltransferase PlsY [Bacillota bacterium]
MLVSVAAVAAAYLIGAIPFGFLMGLWAKGVDIRRYGSGATGGTNVLRVLGWGPALTTALLDAAKGTVATLLGVYLDHGTAAPFGLPGPGWLAAFCGLAAVAGHSWPIYLGFKGGKSVATGAGSMLALFPFYIFLGLPVFLLVVALTRFVSLGSILSTLTITLLVIFRQPLLSDKVWALGIALIVIYRHNANIKRLLAGTESRFGQRVQSK